MLLLTGFGPFLEVTDNPSARLARAVHGARLSPDLTVHAAILPVRYEEAVRQTLRTAAEMGATAIIGTGVARGDRGLRVERVGRRRRDRPDISGALPSFLPDDPPERTSTFDVGALSEALGARVSTDAGAYVCNSWLYEVAGAARVPVAFVHIGDEGADADAFVAGLRRYFATR